MSGSPSLMNLKDDLTCSICLCAFDYPVTIPCGHNFCQSCLLATWKDSYCCPQCRTVFATKPDLKKNTTLSNVVESFKARSPESPEPPELKTQVMASEREQKKVILCDSCLEAPASHTCLTCMASYCEVHLRPHRENPVFKVHQLSEPIQDLLERICKDHYKMMDFFCPQHCSPICSVCLQQVHSMCNFTSLEQHKGAHEAGLQKKCQLLDEKIMKNHAVIDQMKDMQTTLKNSAMAQKHALATEYRHIQEMLAQEEHEAMKALDQEMETAQGRLQTLTKRFHENIKSMGKAKEDIADLLHQSQTIAFLQTNYDLPQAASFDPYAPRLSLDSKKVMAAQGFAVHLKEFLSGILRVPLGDRMLLLKKETASGFTPSKKPEREGATSLPSPLYGPFSQFPPSPQGTDAKKKPQKPTKKGSQSSSGGMGNKSLQRSMENLLDFGGERKGLGQPPRPETTELKESPDMMVFVKRSDLLKYGTVLTFDPKTANKRIILSEDLTKASVSEEPVHLPECPERFAVCSQVLTSKGFSRGRHYWEVRLSNNNFIGIGLAYGSINRKGPSSRLGRNSQSWCVEWFNVKLSAWHNSIETVLSNPNPKRVGVLVDCEEGTATFYTVADRAYPFHCFVFPFTETVYPAIWIFSSGLSVSLCKLH
ncbi:E3 ubiquitin/ISG15 ligase TRIM25-like [Synchiropus splendidus]|uniref:E3 ubiquitin/ISG15 ligase TRIM25-like n=1 Tax=Synchiropus splendidus TaxID=270530 RepID=UPI00237E45FD|nr:E3 ubiquitin/ISG15 ligase TRIM25-like [Synchiropus splendidus]